MGEYLADIRVLVTRIDPTPGLAGVCRSVETIPTGDVTQSRLEADLLQTQIEVAGRSQPAVFSQGVHLVDVVFDRVVLAQ